MPVCGRRLPSVPNAVPGRASLGPVCGSDPTVICGLSSAPAPPVCGNLAVALDGWPAWMEYGRFSGHRGDGRLPPALAELPRSSSPAGSLELPDVAGGAHVDEVTGRFLTLLGPGGPWPWLMLAQLYLQRPHASPALTGGTRLFAPFLSGCSKPGPEKRRAVGAGTASLWGESRPG